MGQGFYGSNLSAFSSSRLTRRISNSVNYKSNAFNGFTASAAFGAGEETDDTKPDNDLMGAALEYANGALTLGAGYQQIERVLTGGDDKEYAFGAGYKFGPVEVKGNYLVSDRTGANNKFEQINVGAAMKVGAAGKVFANVQQNEIESGAEGTAYSIAYSYTLSKRTNLYTSYATMRNKNNGAFALKAASTEVTAGGVPGSDPSAFTVGLRHSF